MVLAAGLGLRMRPRTLDRPKPLLTVSGRTLIDHVLDRFYEAGIETVVVNSHYKGDMIADHLAQRTQPRIQLSPEETLLDTGGGVRRALSLLGRNPFIVANADNIWLNGPVPALERMMRRWDPDQMDALMLLAPTVATVGYSGKGDFLMAPDGQLTRRAETDVAPFVYAGVQIMRPELFDDAPEGPFSANLLWDRALEAGRLFGVRHDGPWYHIGTPDALDDTNRRLDPRNARWAVQ
ncbi:MAG: nucleotidyltransferase family protein [Azospirillaceae bacterium]|nr:nucleotidyltransferase family protein [Azospirillaceae bacterium]